MELQRGGIEREGVPTSGPAGGCHAKLHAGILSVSRVSIYPGVVSFCQKHTHKQKQIKKKKTL